jgi:AraC family transcriptional activator of pyochelin receptor
MARIETTRSALQDALPWAAIPLKFATRSDDIERQLSDRLAEMSPETRSGMTGEGWLPAAQSHRNPHVTHCRYDGVIRGRQHRMELSPGVFAFVTDFDRIPASRSAQSGDDVLLIQFRLEGAVCLADEDGEHSFDRPVCLISYYPRGYEQTVTHQPGPWRGVGLICQKGALQRWGVTAAMPDGLRALLDEPCPGPYMTALAMTREMMQGVREIMACTYSDDLRRAYTEAKSVEILCGVLSRLERYSADEAEHRRFSPGDLRRVRNANEILEAEYALPHSLASVARRVGLNRTKLAAVFKSLYGTTFFDRLREVRMVEACRQLSDGDASITEVARSVGYEDPCSFTRAFKARYGVAPRLARTLPAQVA